MKIAVTGASGLVGSAVMPLLRNTGHEPVRALREGRGTADCHWDPQRGITDPGPWEECDAVVHLAGENIASGRWTKDRKDRIRASRVAGTRSLAEGLARLRRVPRVLAMASAIGYYGSRGEEVLTESSPAGTGFLADVCADWEAAAEPARAAGIRVVAMRFGVILAPRGGALAAMLTPFRLGFGGRVGSGRQFWSWVSIDDVASAVSFALLTSNLGGPVNVVAPHPVTNAEFTRVLGRVLGRPTFFPLPAALARLALGEMADELLLSSARILPERLQATGFEFRHPDLELALRHLLDRAKK